MRYKGKVVQRTEFGMKSWGKIYKQARNLCLTAGEGKRTGWGQSMRRRDRLGVEGGAAKRKKDESVPISVSSWFSLLGLALHSLSLHLLSEDTVIP